MAANRQTDRHTYVYIHTHVYNAVTLVWGSLRLAPINKVLANPKASSYIIGLVATE